MSGEAVKITDLHVQLFELVKAGDAQVIPAPIFKRIADAELIAYRGDILGWQVTAKGSQYLRELFLYRKEENVG